MPVLCLTHIASFLKLPFPEMLSSEWWDCVQGKKVLPLLPPACLSFLPWACSQPLSTSLALRPPKQKITSDKRIRQLLRTLVPLG